MAPRKKVALSGVPQDFRNFLWRVWSFLSLPPPTKVQYEMAEWLQKGSDRQILCAFRGVGKSWITSAFVVFCLAHNVDLKFEVVSASKQRSDDFSIFTKRLINEMPELAYLRGGVRDSNIAFDVGPCRPAHAPSVKSVGIFGQLTGSRADHIIADDVEVPNNSATQDLREKLMKAVSEFESILTPNGRITYLGTPQTEESIYPRLRDERNFEMRIWPARFPMLDKLDAYKGSLAPGIMTQLEADNTLQWIPLDPERFSEDVLLKKEAGVTRADFLLQFMLDTSLSDAERYPLKLSDMIVFDCDPDRAPIALTYAADPTLQAKELRNPGFSADRWFRPMYVDKDWTKYEYKLMAIDPSGRGQDETGYCVLALLHGKVYLLAAGGLKGGYDQSTLKELARIAALFKVNDVVIESNFGDGMYTQLFLPVMLATGHQTNVEEERVTGQKELRICDTIEPVLGQHRLVVSRQVILDDLREIDLTEKSRKYSLFYQLTHVTRERGALEHDDRLDALALGLKRMVDMMARDEMKAANEYRERIDEEELKKFMDGLLDKSLLGTLGSMNKGASRWTDVIGRR